MKVDRVEQLLLYGTAGLCCCAFKLIFNGLAMMVTHSHKYMYFSHIVCVCFCTVRGDILGIITINVRDFRYGSAYSL